MSLRQIGANVIPLIRSCSIYLLYSVKISQSCLTICGPTWQTLFFGAPESVQMVTAAMKLKDACSLGEQLWPLKSRDITFSTMVRLVKAMIFPGVMYGCESWTIKKAECRRNDAFELWCGRRLLRVLWAARRSNQSILKEISPEYSLEGLMLKLKLQYVGHLMRRANSLKKIWMLGKTDAEAETPILWPPDAKNCLIWKDPDAGKDWRWEEKGMTEDEMVGWHHQLNGYEFE